jgi:hypothetical protein
MNARAMTGRKNLSKLLSSMDPQLLPDTYVFASIPQAKYGDYEQAHPIATMLEPEGLTLVLTRQSADHLGFKYDSTFRCITLMAQSPLDAVGLTAAVAAKLASHGISANVIAGYFHDHVFVQSERAEFAMQILRQVGS